MPIRNPIEWAIGSAQVSAEAVGLSATAAAHTGSKPLPDVARISLADLRSALAKGFADFAANRTDVILLCLLYPVIGLVLGRVASGENTLPLLFPLAAGFALLGPLAATGLYEMSRRRELGATVGWADAFGVLRSPAIGSIVLLGLLLCAIFVLWLFAAQGIYTLTMGPAAPASVNAFIHDVFNTPGGRIMILLGMGTGFLFALVVLTIGVVSFPMLIDRDVGVETAVLTSIRAVAANPVPIAAWGLIVAVMLAVASIPLFVGLVVALPVLGHATWHLYRSLVPR